MRRMITFSSLALIIPSFISTAQDLVKTDSIYRLLLVAPGDTDLINSLNSSIDNLSYSHSDTALHYARELDSLSIIAEYPHGSAMALNLQGVCYELSGDIQKAIETYLQAARLSQEHGLQNTLSNVYNNLGLAFAIFTAHHFLEGRMKSLIRRT
jgi:tetratricopeptide (TPR) repeat protein